MIFVLLDPLLDWTELCDGLLLALSLPLTVGGPRVSGTGGGGGLDNRDNNQRDEASRIQALRTANCIKILGKGVIRVVHRVDDARENNALGE